MDAWGFRLHASASFLKNKKQRELSKSSRCIPRLAAIPAVRKSAQQHKPALSPVGKKGRLGKEAIHLKKRVFHHGCLKLGFFAIIRRISPVVKRDAAGEL